MRFLIPLLLSEMFLLSWGTASAQAPVIDGYADAQELDMSVLRDDRAAMDRARMPLMADSAPVSLVPRIVRLRTVGSSLAAIVTDASVRSATFRHLAHAISRTDGIVYVEDGECGHTNALYLFYQRNGIRTGGSG